MDLFKEAEKIYGEEWQSNHREYKTKSMHTGQTIFILKKELQDCTICKPNKAENKFNIHVPKPDKDTLNSVLKSTSKLGWIPLKLKYTNLLGEEITNNWWDQAKEFSEGLETIIIEFGAKFDFSIDKIPPYMYHAIPTENWCRLRSVGLLPKSRTGFPQHPKRLYLTKTIEDAEFFAKELYSGSKFESCIIAEIYTPYLDNYLRLYEDSKYPSKGYYTMNKICTSDIKMIKEFHLD